MAYLFSDSFDLYSAAADYVLRWDSASLFIAPSVSTAFGYGSAAQGPNVSNQNGTLVKNFSNESTLFVALRRKSLGGTQSTAYTYVTLSDVGTSQVTVMFYETGNIEIRSGGTAGTLLGTIAGACPSSVWDQFQIKAVIHPTAGSVEIRKNGSSTPLAAPLTNVNTRPGTNTFANKVTLGMQVANTSPAITAIDDFFVCSGSGGVPNDWPGDIRGFTQVPTGNALTQFTPSQTTGTSNTSTGTSPLALSSDTLQFYKIFPGFGGPCTQGTALFNSSAPPKAKIALYAADGPSGGPGTLLAASNEVAPATSGVNTFTFPTPATLQRGVAYWVAIHHNAISTGGGSTTGIANGYITFARAYTSGFPASVAAGTPVTGQAVAIVLTMTPVTQASLVADTTGQDGDATYVASSTVGQEDLYTFPSLPINPASIIGVAPFAILKKTDAGARTASVQAKSGATEVAAASSAAISQSYQYLGSILGTDPSTGIAWTRAGVESLQVGPKVVA